MNKSLFKTCFKINFIQKTAMNGANLLLLEIVKTFKNLK